MAPIDRQIALLDQTIEAYQLRSKSRLSYAEIGKRMNPPISKQAAFRRVRAGLKLYGRQATDAFRETMLVRLEGLYQAIAPRLIAGDLAGIKTALLILDQESRLQGLEPPKTLTLAMSLTESQWAAVPDDMLKRILQGKESIDAILGEVFAGQLPAPGQTVNPTVNPEIVETVVLHDAGPEQSGPPEPPRPSNWVDPGNGG